MLDYSDRRGFDAGFLGADLPLPGVSGSVDPGALHYHHFSVIMNSARRLAILSAANLDGRRRFTKVAYSDRWIIDPRLPADAQAGNALYTGNDLDRGHLTRRADMLWGDTAAEAGAAVTDTYHYTNCAPQHRDFNQNDTTWQGLENYILVTVGDQRLRANVYTGPVFNPGDPVYRGVRIPKAFWKVVAVGTADRVHATAYLIEQTNLLDTLGRAAEEAPLGAYRTYQTNVRHIETLTGVDFGVLRTYDPLDPPPGEAEEPMPTELHGLGDIKL